MVVTCIYVTSSAADKIEGLLYSHNSNHLESTRYSNNIINNVYACSLIMREDVMHKPRFMLEVYPADYNSIKEAFILHKVYDVIDSLNNRIPYYVEVECLIDRWVWRLHVAHLLL